MIFAEFVEMTSKEMEPSICASCGAEFEGEGEICDYCIEDEEGA